MNKIFKKYTDISSPGSFSGLSGFLKNNKFKKKQAIKNLSSKEPFTLHQSVRHKFKRNRIIVGCIDDQWQADLVDVHQIKYQNKHFNYILTCIDVFSKKAWAVPIKAKTAANCAQAFKLILDEGRVPRTLYIDGGNEFKGDCKRLFEKHNIKVNLTKSKFKASVVERFNRTLKEKMWRIFTYNKNKKYVDILPDILQSYNNSYHRSIKTTPSKVTKLNQQQIFINLYGYDKLEGSEDVAILKFKIGDYVRISIDKNLFEKGYTANWSKEIYIIRNIILKSQPLYDLNALDGEELNSRFYDNEIQKVLPSEFEYDTFEVESINNGELLVTKLNSETAKPFSINKEAFLK